MKRKTHFINYLPISTKINFVLTCENSQEKDDSIFDDVLWAVRD